MPNLLFVTLQSDRIFEEPIQQPLVTGDIIFYWHPIFVCGDKRGMRTANIVEVDPELSLPIMMDNGDRLSRMQSVKRLHYVQWPNEGCRKPSVCMR
jgi:hypothetical protein